jgi:hypothetical protein
MKTEDIKGKKRGIPAIIFHEWRGEWLPCA